MLAIEKRNKFIQKAVKMPNGEWAMVVFELIERDGRIIAKAIRAEAIKQTTTSEDEKCLLPGIVSPTEFIPVKSIFTDFVSIFTKDFSFTSCQVTRAPNFC